jgi:hypothetical protein
MNRRVLIGSSFASLVLSIGLAGCDSGAIDEGLPPEIPKTAVVPVDSMRPDMSKQTAQVKAADKNKAATTTPPAGAAPTEPEKKD